MIHRNMDYPPIYFGTSHFGLLHIGHRYTSGFLGTHRCPQRLHVTNGSLIVLMDIL